MAYIHWMKNFNASVAREVKEMTRREVIQKAIEGNITWLQAADICQVSPRHMLRLRLRYQELGIDGLRDRRTGKRQSRVEYHSRWREMTSSLSYYGASLDRNGELNLGCLFGYSWQTFQTFRLFFDSRY